MVILGAEPVSRGARVLPARPGAPRYPRYIGVGEAIVRVLQDLGGAADVDTVLREVWRRYVSPGDGERVVMRLYSHPAGRLWSPEAEEALRSLEALGLVERRGRRLLLRAAPLARS
jgi:hypothetical protein